MSAFTPKAPEADCTAPVFGPVAPSTLAMRGFRFIDDEDGAKPKPKDDDPDPDKKPAPKPESKSSEDDDDDTELTPAARAKIAKVNREAKGLRDRLKELEDAERERVDAKKDDLTKAQEALADRETKLSSSELTIARLQVALDKGLTEKQAARLVGATREELEADADDFLKDLGPQDGEKKTPPTRQPRERLRGGGDPTEEGADDDVEDALAHIPR
jgi:hypothetical protein